MASHLISIEHKGATYTGRYEIVGHAEQKAVSVQYETDSISAPSGPLHPEVVAKTLLGELVQAKETEPYGTRSEPLHYRYGRH